SASRPSASRRRRRLPISAGTGPAPRGIAAIGITATSPRLARSDRPRSELRQGARFSKRAGLILWLKAGDALVQVLPGLFQRAADMGERASGSRKQRSNAVMQRDREALDALLERRIIAPCRVEQQAVRCDDDQDGHNASEHNVAYEMTFEHDAQTAKRRAEYQGAAER